MFLPSENEWYKAAYYDPNHGQGGPPSTATIGCIPTSSNTVPTAEAPTAR